MKAALIHTLALLVLLIQISITQGKRSQLSPKIPRILQPVSSQPQFIWVNCFTGFGAASLIQLNEVVAAQPTIADCIKKIQEQRPEYTVEKLREKVDAYEKATKTN